jgi:hypothetical protein
MDESGALGSNACSKVCPLGFQASHCGAGAGTLWIMINAAMPVNKRSAMKTINEKTTASLRHANSRGAVRMG